MENDGREFHGHNKTTCTMLNKLAFKDILDSLNDNIYHDDMSIVECGDCNDIMRRIPFGSVSAVIADLPCGFLNGSTAYNLMDNMQISALSNKWMDVLKPGGSLFILCSPGIVDIVKSRMDTYFNVVSEIIWSSSVTLQRVSKKWKPQRMTMLHFEKNSEFCGTGMYIKTMRKMAGLSCKELADKIGVHGNVNHGGVVSNWERGRSVPTKEQYEKLKDIVVSIDADIRMHDYEDAVRQFYLERLFCDSDVWPINGVKKYEGMHPDERPVELFEQCVLSSTNPGDIVIDCFSGSGSATVAAVGNGRRCVSIEKDSGWCDLIKRRMLMLKSAGYDNVHLNSFMKNSTNQSISYIIGL